VLQSDNGERRDLDGAGSSCLLFAYEEKKHKVREQHRNNFNMASGLYRIEAAVPDVSIWLPAL
jgi:hypothetical protein